MGGLMSLYAILEYNQYFSGAAVLSPSLWANADEIQNLMKTAKIHPHTKIYMDYGSNEMKASYRRAKMLFQKATTLLLKRGIFLTSRIVPYGDHCEACWEKQIPHFMNAILYNGYH